MKYFLILIILIAITIDFNSYKSPEKDNCFGRILDQISNNKPNIGSEYAHTLSKIICRASNEAKVESEKVAAILMQESSYKLNTINYRSKDYGISQINIRKIKELGLNKNRLLTDLEYSIKACINILAKIDKKHGNEKDSWTRYHSNKKKHRNKYYKLVSRYL